MMTFVVPFVVGLAVTAQTGPSAAELERAHRLLAGTWDVLEMVDDGETLSHDLIRSKLAEGGRIRVVDRSFEIVNPATGEARTTAFRIDPSQSPPNPESTPPPLLAATTGSCEESIASRATSW